MKRIYNICPYISYSNAQLMKDCVLIPYTFTKLYAYEAVIVTAQREEFSYVELLPGLLVDVQPLTASQEDWKREMLDYIRRYYEQMDILFCFGSYLSNQEYVALYKDLKPDGTVITKLDLNSFWMDRLQTSNQKLYTMYEKSDLITCESKRLKRILSEKWPFEFDYVVNGYLPDLQKKVGTDYGRKEKIILTVGRIGTEQKSNPVLLEAFAACAKEYTDWKLRLVGRVEPSFEPYIHAYFAKHPHLKERVIFTGNISDKQKLQEEYERAKIFALTSAYEGGEPNVFSEAASHGCYMITSQIDACAEITNWNRCGKSFPIHDVKALTELFHMVLADAFEKELRENYDRIIEYHKRNYNYEKIVQKMMHLLELKRERRR